MKLVYVRIKIGKLTLYQSAKAYLEKTAVFSEELRAEKDDRNREAARPSG